MGTRRGNFRLGRIRAERRETRGRDGRGRGGARAGRRQLDEEEHHDRKRHENTNDEKGRVGLASFGRAGGGPGASESQGCERAHIRFLAQIRNRDSARMSGYSAMIRVACKIPLWKMSV